jgi:hypothetical protein
MFQVRAFDDMDTDFDSALRPTELMAYLKALAPLMSATERRRLALHVYSFTVVKDTRRITQVATLDPL